MMLKLFFFGLSIVCFSLTGFSQSYDILLITGGRKMEKAAFVKMFADFEEIKWMEVEQPKANQWIADHKVDHWDLLVFYDMHEPITEREKAGYIRWLNMGKPMLFLHHSLVSYQHWSEFQEIIGGRYYDEKIWSGLTPEKGYSTYQHDVEIPIKVENPQHPAVTGLTDFTVIDEIYGNVKVLDRVTPLLTTNLKESERILMWETKFRDANIIYIMPGHGPHIFQDNSYQKLVYNSIIYLSNQ